MPTTPFELGPVTGGEPLTVSASGELDVTSAGSLESELRREMVGQVAVDAVVVDLRDVTFCDAAGVNALLALRRETVRSAVKLVLRTSPSVDRVLDAAGVAELFDRD